MKYQITATSPSFRYWQWVGEADNLNTAKAIGRRYRDTITDADVFIHFTKDCELIDHPEYFQPVFIPKYSGTPVATLWRDKKRWDNTPF